MSSWNFEWLTIWYIVDSFFQVRTSKFLQESFLEFSWSCLRYIWSSIRANQHPPSVIWLLQQTVFTLTIEIASWGLLLKLNSLEAPWLIWVKSRSNSIFKWEQILLLLSLVILIRELNFVQLKLIKSSLVVSVHRFEFSIIICQHGLSLIPIKVVKSHEVGAWFINFVDVSSSLDGQLNSLVRMCAVDEKVLAFEGICNLPVIARESNLILAIDNNCVPRFKWFWHFSTINFRHDSYRILLWIFSRKSGFNLISWEHHQFIKAFERNFGINSVLKHWWRFSVLDFKGNLVWVCETSLFAWVCLVTDVEYSKWNVFLVTIARVDVWCVVKAGLRTRKILPLSILEMNLDLVISQTLKHFSCDNWRSERWWTGQALLLLGHQIEQLEFVVLVIPTSDSLINWKLTLFRLTCWNFAIATSFLIYLGLFHCELVLPTFGAADSWPSRLTTQLNLNFVILILLVEQSIKWWNTMKLHWLHPGKWIITC